MTRLCPDSHRHEGTTTCYHDHGCRCRPCTDNMSARTRDRYRQRAYGRYEGRVSPLGVIRRYQGLQVLGWRAEDIARQAGYSAPEPLKRLLNNKYVTPATRDKVKRACDELVRRGRGDSKVTATRAERKGWVSPFAWDDIDDPNETPSTGTDRRLGGDELISELEWLVNSGVPAHQIASTLGKKRDVLERFAWRYKRNDLASYLRERNAA